MKKFILGALCATLIFSLSISALAISGHMTIEVSPINIQVNGETFVPKDVNGMEVPVFAYNGTTYAPLRALAEAYSLEVGYDQATNMATVVDPEAPAAPADDSKTTFGSDEETAYQEFKSMWTMIDASQTGQRVGKYVYSGDLSRDDITSSLKAFDTVDIGAWTWNAMEELCEQRGLTPLGADLYYYYGDTSQENLIFWSDCMGGVGHNGYGSIGWD